jgi:hypothetical protein
MDFKLIGLGHKDMVCGELGLLDRKRSDSMALASDPKVLLLDVCGRADGIGDDGFKTQLPENVVWRLESLDRAVLLTMRTVQTALAAAEGTNLLCGLPERLWLPRRS